MNKLATDDQTAVVRGYRVTVNIGITGWRGGILASHLCCPAKVVSPGSQKGARVHSRFFALIHLESRPFLFQKISCIKVRASFSSQDMHIRCPLPLSRGVAHVLGRTSLGSWCTGTKNGRIGTTSGYHVCLSTRLIALPEAV